MIDSLWHLEIMYNNLNKSHLDSYGKIEVNKALIFYKPGKKFLLSKFFDNAAFDQGGWIQILTRII